MSTIRTTTLGSTTSMLDYIKTAETKYNKLSEEAASGLKVTTPSDDATATKSIIDITAQLSQLETYVSNMKTSQSELDTLDDTLSSLTDMISNATDLATQAANGTYTQDDLDDIKAQVDSIISSVTDLANTQYNGKYIFSGTATSTAAYTTAADGSITYNGNDDSRYVTISSGVSVGINADGESIFGSYDATTSTGTGLLGNLSALSAALANGGTTTYNGATFTASSSIDALADNLDTVTTAQTKFAAVTNRFTMTTTAIENTITNLKEQKSNLQDADLTEVLTDLTAQQTALEATYQITSELLSGTTLLDYL